MREFEAAGFSSNAIATSARRLGEARDALSYAERMFAASLGLSFGNEVFARLDREAFEHGPALLRQRVIARLIDRYGGDSPAPQLSEIEDLVARMQRDGGSGATLGGAVISVGPRFIRVWREAGRLDHSELCIFPGEEIIWDRRFLLRRNGPESSLEGVSQTDSVIVRPLGERGHASVLARLDPTKRPPARAIFALPSFWRGGDLVAAPSLAPFSRLDVPPLDPAGFEIVPLAPSASY
jgi:tRNA(Ile)-lysidine synthase